MARSAREAISRLLQRKRPELFRAPRWVRPLAAATAIALVGLAARHFAAPYWGEIPRLRGLIAASGAIAPVVFGLLFPLAAMLWIPGIALLALGVVAFGPLPGALLSLLGSLLAVSWSFALVRWLGGLSGPRNGTGLAPALARLERRPVMTVALLRLVFWMSPWVNGGLALSPIRFRHYFLGSALGLAVAIGGATLLLSYL